MKKFKYVEDYIEYIGRASDGLIIGISNILGNTRSQISLARYDVDIISSLYQQVAVRRLGLTEKQAKLAQHLIVKYERQLKNNGIELPDSLDEFRLPIRKVSNIYSVGIDHAAKKFEVKFPYNTDLISKFRATKTSDDISAIFDPDKKAWMFSMTEHNLNFIKATCSEKQFVYDEEVTALFNEILKIEENPYKIELTDVDGKLTISNAPNSMVEYINANVGEIHYGNLLKLIDLSTTLDYTVSDVLLTVLEQLCPDPLQRQLLTQKTIKIPLGEFNFEKIVEYAELINRAPIYAYVNSYKSLHKFQHSSVKHLNKSWPESDTPIKLFISQSPVLIGVRKNTMLKMAEKVIIVEHHEIMQNNY
jgi:hypothetical protein